MKQPEMKNADFNRLLETAMRRPLTADEEAQLLACFAEDPSAKAIREEEMALARLLHRLPDAPLATNFTAQVLQAVEQAERQHRSRAPTIPGRLTLRNPVSRWMAAGLAAVLVALCYWQYQSLRREKLAVSLAHIANNMETVSDVTSLPPVEPWENFDAINRLPPPADEQLLTALEVTMK